MTIAITCRVLHGVTFPAEASYPPTHLAILCQETASDRITVACRNGCYSDLKATVGGAIVVCEAELHEIDLSGLGASAGAQSGKAYRLTVTGVFPTEVND